MTKGAQKSEIDILAISQSYVDVCVLGTMPLICNSMSVKAKRELLLPKGRKTAADRAQSLKHDPVEEFRASVYRQPGDGVPTRLVFPAPGLKGAMATAALDLPGAKKTEIGRLTWVPGKSVDLYGVPELLMSVVRSADINKTPDIRTRAILPRWALRLRVHFVRPKLNEQSVVNLLAAAGVTCGIGDFRQEKGKGSFGQFVLASPDDPAFQEVVAEGGREAQDAALADPRPHDADTEELLAWYGAEVVRLRGPAKAAA